MTRFPCLARLAAAAFFPLLGLSGCAFRATGDVPQRTSVSLSAPSTIQRSERLQREVARMDAEAFPLEGLALKLSYELSPVPPAAGARAA